MQTLRIQPTPTRAKRQGGIVLWRIICSGSSLHREGASVVQPAALPDKPFSNLLGATRLKTVLQYGFKIIHTAQS